MLTFEQLQKSMAQPSFHNMQSLLQLIDALPRAATWSCEVMEVQGDELGDDGEPHVERLELWKRDPIDCIQELIGNPAFKSNMKYAPYRVYETQDGENRCWDEMATGEWWWDMQVRECYNRVQQVN